MPALSYPRDPRIAEARRRDILAVARDLGAVLKPIVRGIEFAGACLACGGTDRFSVNTKKQVFNCRGACGGDVVSMVQHLKGASFAEALEYLTGERPASARQQAAEPPAKPEDRRSKALWLWRQRQPIVDGSPAWSYLRDARGYTGPIPPTLGFLPARGLYAPSMIAAYGLAAEPSPGVLTIADRDVRAVHLTRLTPDGRKVAGGDAKITIGSPLGSPIVLAPMTDSLALAISEGTEDGVSVFQATGVGIWAAGAAGFMPALENVVPDWAEVMIFAHRDRAGEANAAELNAALKRRKIRSEILFLDSAEDSSS